MIELKNEKFESESLVEIKKILSLQGCLGGCEPLAKNVTVTLAALRYDGWGIELIGWSMYRDDRKGYICYKETDNGRVMKKFPFGRIMPYEYETLNELKAAMKTALAAFICRYGEQMEEDKALICTGRKAKRIKILYITRAVTDTDGKPIEGTKSKKAVVWNEDVISAHEVEDLIKQDALEFDDRVLLIEPGQVPKIFPHHNAQTLTDNCLPYWKPCSDRHDYIHCECSRCGLMLEAVEAVHIGDSSDDYTGVKYKWCPNCGAYMGYRKEVGKGISNRTRELTVDTPMGTLVAYPSTDSQNPGVFVDLWRPGTGCALNLAAVECSIDEGEHGSPSLKLHAWGDGGKEDATLHTAFQNIDAYFSEERKNQDE